MAENTQEKLKQAIASAQRGDKLAARRLLQQVLGEDRDNELAWMWMASVVDSVDERRACLERVLKINPNNPRAREALRRLGGDPQPAAPAARENSALPGAAEVFATGSNRSLYFAIAAALAIVLVALFLVSIFSSPPSDNSIAQTATAFAVVQIPTDIPPTVNPADYTATPFLGIVVTLGPNVTTPLPPTFTPTPTGTATPQPPPTATPLPLDLYSFVFTTSGGGAQPGLASANADGSNVRPLVQDFGDLLAVSPAGDSVAFVRLVPVSGDVIQPTAEGTPAEGEETPTAPSAIPQLFIAPLGDPAAARQVTTLVSSAMSRPAWTPDGQRIVFSSNQDGDGELYIVDAAGGSPLALTNNDANDTDPTISLDGRTIVFASDLETPGSQELFSIAIDGSQFRQLTNATGSSTSPMFSPDGSRIAFVSDRGGDGDIWVMDANGQRPFLITIDDGDAEDRSPVWTPDARWILFISNRQDETFRVYLISLDGSTLLPVTSGTDNVQSIAMLPLSSR